MAASLIAGDRRRDGVVRAANVHFATPTAADPRSGGIHSVRPSSCAQAPWPLISATASHTCLAATDEHQLPRAGRPQRAD